MVPNIVVTLFLLYLDEREIRLTYYFVVVNWWIQIEERNYVGTMLLSLLYIFRHLSVPVSLILFTVITYPKRWNPFTLYSELNRFISVSHWIHWCLFSGLFVSQSNKYLKTIICTEGLGWEGVLSKYIMVTFWVIRIFLFSRSVTGIQRFYLSYRLVVV